MQNAQINTERLEYFKEELVEYDAVAQVLLAIKTDGGIRELMIIVGTDWISEEETRALMIQILRNLGYGIIEPGSKN